MAVREVATTLVDPEIGGSNSLGTRLATLRRYWWVVVGVLWLCLVGAAASAATTPTTYVGRSSLIVSSNNRSPDQDAVLVQGYAAYFDDASYQKQLLGQAQIHGSSTVGAQAAASSPILVITATALDPVAAQANAVAVSGAFSDDINETHSRETAAALATLQNQLDTALGRNGRQDQAVIASLQDQIRTLQADQVNVLQVLQLQGGVSTQPKPWLTNLVLGGAGGLLLGVLAALALGALSQRVRSRYDLAHKVGLDTLAEVPGRGDPDLSSLRLRRLANVLRVRLDGPGVVTVAEALEGPAAAAVARGLAVEWARQGYTTVLVRLGAETTHQVDRPHGRRIGGAGDGGPSVWLERRSVDGLSVVEALSSTLGGSRGFPAAALGTLLGRDELTGAYVVVEATDVSGSAVSQAAAAAADLTVLVVDPATARLTETREAVRVLRESGAPLLGGVLAPASGKEGTPVVDEAELSSPVRDGAGPTASEWTWDLNGNVQDASAPRPVPQHNGVRVDAPGAHAVAATAEVRPDR